MSAHAVLSPSSAERWITCPASVRLSSEIAVEEVESTYASEGSCAHALAELKARARFRGDNERAARRRWTEEWPEFQDPEIVQEMDEHTDAYVDLLRQRLPHRKRDRNLYLERRVETGIPGCWGTADAVIVRPEVVDVVDFKYGKGVRVNAAGNPQLRLYALGVLESLVLWPDPAELRLTIHQPRLDHTDTETITPGELRAWAVPVREAAAVALAGSEQFGPSEAACRWCPVSGRCAAQTAAAFPDDLESGNPGLLSGEDIAGLLPRLPALREWLTAFEAAALDEAQHDRVPGYKVVRSGGRRGWTDPEEVVALLPAELTQRKPLGIGAVERRLGKDFFDTTLGHLVEKSEGKLSIAPEDDPRPAVDPDKAAAAAFDTP